jgi:endonuclease YncB( thermonuclease family)
MRSGLRILPKLLVALLLWTVAMGMIAGPAMAAEILSVRSATLLQIGDQNRSYSIQLACLAVAESNQQDALAWLQKHGPRGTKVNLRPISEMDGRLVAQVRVLKTGQDLGEGLVSEGLATPKPCGEGLPAS